MPLSIIQKSNLPLIAIIGRVNVGKSTLFNKMIEKRKALVSEIPGTTRDLNFGIAEWQGKKFEIVDTGGMFEIKISRGCHPERSEGSRVNNKNSESITYQTEKKTRGIINQAGLILFLVDAQTEILAKDRLIAQFLKNNKKPVILVVNKIDKKHSDVSEFKKLGIGKPIGIAAASGVGVGDLMDEIIKTFPPSAENHKNISALGGKSQKQEYKNNIKVSIIGKPNVGKSSLLNKILGENRVIVSPIPHTTREPQNTFLEFENQTIELVDTAGIRKKAKISTGRHNKPTLESQGVSMSISVLKKSEIALFVLDVSENFSSQDAELTKLIIESGISVIIVANKYDLLERDLGNAKALQSYINNFFPFLSFAPIILVSAKTGRNSEKILSLILEVHAARHRQIADEELKFFTDYLMKKMPPPRQQNILSGKKRRAFITKIIQKKTDRPIFIVETVNKIKIPESYLGYLENNIRSRYKFLGTPIKIVVERVLPLKKLNCFSFSRQKKFPTPKRDVILTKVRIP